MSRWQALDSTIQTVAGLFMGEFAASEAYSGSPGFALRLGYGYDKFNWFGNYKSHLPAARRIQDPGFRHGGRLRDGA